MKTKVLSLALLALLAISTFAIFPVKAVGDNMYTAPASVNGAVVGLGNTFQVTVWLDTVSNVNAWQAYITYESTQLQLMAESYTGSGKSLWSGILPTDNPSPSSGVHSGTVLYTFWGEVLKNSAEQAVAGSLVVLTFKVIAAPGKYETLSSMISVDLVGAFQSSAADKNFVNVPLTFSNTAYTYVWVPPTSNPTPAVSPASVVYGPSPPSAVGQLFDINVYLNNVDVGWAVHNVTLDLVNDNVTLIGTNLITLDPLWGVGSSIVEGPVCTYHFVCVNPTTTPNGNVLLGTIKFIVLQQGNFGHNWIAHLNLINIVVWDTSNMVPTNNPVNGLVTINGLQTLANPYFQVSSATLGPGPAVGQLFNITVSIKDLDPAWFFIGYDFRLSYDPTLITPVAIYEGPFLPHYSALQPGSVGTFFYGSFEPADLFWPEHVLVGGLIFPNATGRWNGPWPNSAATDSTVAIITFQVLYQSFGEPDITSPLEIIDQHAIYIQNPAADPQLIDYLPMAPPHNGTYTITTDWPGRVIDVYTQYPAPYGGQGYHMPSDMFWPQKQVELYANITYNYWPVQQKDVAFEIRDPSGALWDIMVGRTDANGVAHVSFRIPWPCDHPETLFGVWTVTVTVDVACIVIEDHVQFHFDYLTEIFSVTTDKFQYNHCDEVKITVTYGSHSQQIRPLLLYVVIKDNLNVPIGTAFVNTTIGGTVFCTYKNWTKTLSIHIPKFAFAGIAKVYVTAYDTLPTLGGSAYAPTYGMGWPIGATVPEIAIQPY
jgi:hypothetical protein